MRRNGSGTKPLARLAAQPTDWPDKIDTIRWVYSEMVRKIAPGELVRMLVNSSAAERQVVERLVRAGLDVGASRLACTPPIAAGLATWAGFRAPRRGNRHRPLPSTPGPSTRLAEGPRVPEAAARRMGKRLFHAESNGAVCAGSGGIEVNGRGTLLTTRSVISTRPRRFVTLPGPAGIEAALKEYLGVTNVFWLGGGVAGDDTHGHVDDLCRFVNPKRCADPGGRSGGHQLPGAVRELGANSGSPAGGRLEAEVVRCPCRGRCTSMATGCPPATPTSTFRTRR